MVGLHFLHQHKAIVFANLVKRITAFKENRQCPGTRKGNGCERKPCDTGDIGDNSFLHEVPSTCKPNGKP